LVDTQAPDVALFPERVGDRLRTARMKAGLDLSDIATRTRVPLRHLQAIESGDYSTLPSTTYCVGFVKSYARAVELDEAELARDLRGELGQTKADSLYESVGYEDADPVRMPKKLLAWTAAGLALVMAIGWGVWRNQMNGPDTLTPTVAEAPEADAPSAPVAASVAPAANPAGQVALTATSPVWVRIYDANDKVLFEKEMAQGERFDVPAGANGPQIRTGRADLIAVTVDGKPVPALGPAERTIKNVGISAAALAARVPEPATMPAGNASATSAASAPL
jgi:cytoskeleton protein RodZ